MIALIEAGANVHAVDNVGNSALHKAALNGHIECVRALLKAGASNVDIAFNLAVGELKTFLDLIDTATQGDLDRMNLLLSAGANPNSRKDNDGDTALMWAARK